MLKQLQKQRKNAFSLMELLLVLVILATLTALVAPKFSGRSKQARITAAKADIANIELGIDSYEIDTGTLPDSGQGLEALIEEPSDIQNWNGPYLKRGVPKDPWGNEYIYNKPGKHNENGYDLYSAGPDGKEGTDDDVVNWNQDH